MKDDSRGLGKLVADKLRAQLQGAAPGCPEAETLAAYVDQVLSRGERESLQTHLALCARCQEQVAELVRLSEAEEPPKVFVPARRKAWFAWALAAPALVGLLVGALWYTGEFRPALKQQEPVALKPPPRPESGPLPAEFKEAEAPPKLAQQGLGNAPLTRKARHGALSESATTTLKPAAESGAVGAVAGTGVATESLTVPTPGAIAPPSERARLAVPPPLAKARDEAPAEEARDDRVAARAGAPVPALGAAPLAKGETPGEVATAVADAIAPAERQSPGFFGRGDVVAKKVVARQADGEWQVGRHGLIQKRDTRGNWVTQASGVDADLFDITFATPSVGWAVGRAGTVLRTTDGGTTWNKVATPTRADLIRVTASGELTAMIVARGGQAFTTADGGKSWKVTPQD